MAQIQARIVGVELYFEHLQAARDFYAETVGLEVSNEELGHHAQFSSASGFVCLEKKGVEAYPSRDKPYCSSKCRTCDPRFRPSAKRVLFNVRRTGP